MSKTILLSGHFGGPQALNKLTYLERLDVYLQEQGYHLVLLNKSLSEAQTSLTCINCPTDTTAPHRIRGKHFLKDEELSPHLLRAASIEAEATQCSLAESGLKLLIYQGWSLQILKKYKPVLCILWHQFNGRHYLLSELCKSKKIPYLYMEYGSIPGMVTFDLDGQMGESRVAQNYKRFISLPVTPEQREKTKQLIEHIRNTKKTNKPQNSEINIHDLVSVAKERNRPVIFYAGQNDWESGMLPKPFREARIHSPIYEDTLDALNHLSKLAYKNNWHILFKPHPLVEERHKCFTVDYPEHVDLACGANIFDCIELSDITTTIVSQAGYLALIHGRPVVMLGCTKLWHKLCVYQPAVRIAPADRADVEDSFVKALSEGFSESQQANFVKHVAQLCFYNHFTLAEELEPIVGRGPDHAARSLRLFINNSENKDGFPFASDLPSPHPSKPVSPSISKRVQQFLFRK